MKFLSALIAVKDMEASKRFYTELMEQPIVSDFGANVTVGGGVSLQTLDTWTDFIDKSATDICFGGLNTELYYETEDIDVFMDKLKAWPDVELVHGVKEFPWGQRSVRIYDPDRHIVEVGESLDNVVGRFLLQGMSVSQVCERSMLPPQFVEMCKAALVQQGKLKA